MPDGFNLTSGFAAALSKCGIPYLLAGSFSSNFWGIARSTRDADFVVVLELGSLQKLELAAPEDLVLDPQSSFETVTGTFRHIFTSRSSPFKIELFILSDDPHDKARFERRIKIDYPSFPSSVFLPTPEDVVVTKLRWFTGADRAKDGDDLRNIIAVQHGKLDWPYIHHWAAEHGTRQTLDEIVASIPPDLLEETP